MDIHTAKYRSGDIAPMKFAPSYIALSYFVSLVGSLSTLELLQRRTSWRGLYNWYLLLGSAFSMGSVSIWCMHFIGLRALVLYGGEPSLQVVYSPTYTAISFFLPILVLLGAYMIAGTGEDSGRFSKVRIVSSGFFASLSIDGMHYCGQAGIMNYTPVYSTGYVAGSIIIAIAATVGSMWLFFVWRQRFINSWGKRVICAITLSGGVSGMHWTASMGTRYRFREASTQTENISRNAVVIITIIISVIACVSLIALALYGGRKQKSIYQKVVLASVTFDDAGRLMVWNDGTLPSKTITHSFYERAFDENSVKSHPVFHWVYRTSRNWKSVVDLIPSMELNHRKGSTIFSLEPTSADVNSLTFRKEFCLAAAELADDIKQPLEELGVLFDEIVETGTSTLTRNPFSKATASEDGQSDSGNGKVLFLVKLVDQREATKFCAQGFRFTEPLNVTNVLSKSLQVPKDTVTKSVSAMAVYSKNSDSLLTAGVHVGCFALRPTVKDNFEVLVRQKTRNQIPTVPLLIRTLSPLHLRFLRQYDGKTVDYILRSLFTEIGALSSPEIPTLIDFASKLHDALVSLKGEIADPFFGDAVLVPGLHDLPSDKPVERLSKESATNTPVATLIAFKFMIPIHIRELSTRDFMFSSVAFFSAQQRCYAGCNDHAIHARKIYGEFCGPSLEDSQTMSAPKQKRGLSGPWKSWRSKHSAFVNTTSSQMSLASEEDFELDRKSAGIMVSQSVAIDVVPAQDNMEMKAMGLKSVASQDAEEPTWVGRLFEAAWPNEKIKPV